MTELTTMTPAEIATKALEGIASAPGSLDMGDWIRTDQVVLLADEQPGCGTTLCAAGWICHAAGLTLDEWGRVLLTNRNGRKYQMHVDAIAETFWHIHKQPRSAWAQEIDLRPYKENF